MAERVLFVRKATNGRVLRDVIAAGVYMVIAFVVLRHLWRLSAEGELETGDGAISLILALACSARAGKVFRDAIDGLLSGIVVTVRGDQLFLVWKRFGRVERTAELASRDVTCAANDGHRVYLRTTEGGDIVLVEAERLAPGEAERIEMFVRG